MLAVTSTPFSDEVVNVVPPSTSTACYPSWHAIFAPLASGSQVTVASGCRVNAQGNVPCAPEKMRAVAEAQLQRLVSRWLFDGKLSLDAYTLARYMQTEVGDGTIEERVAVGEAAVNRARLKKPPTSVVGLLLFNQRFGHPNRGYYGPIHGPGGVTTSPYDRWASTSKDPTVLTLLLAIAILNGLTDNFSRGADDQVGLEYASAFPNPAGFVQKLARQGDYWVGPLPGVDHWRTFLTRSVGVSPASPTGATLLMRGLLAVSSRTRPIWSREMPICMPREITIAGKPRSTKNIIVGLVATLGLVGLSWVSLQVAKDLAAVKAMPSQRRRV